MRRFQKVGQTGAARRKCTGGIAHKSDSPRHIEWRPNRDSIAKVLRENTGIVRKVARQVPVWPASPVFKRLGEIPVIHRAPRADAGGEERIDQPAIVIQPLHVRNTGSGWLNAWPGDRETVALQVKAFGQRDVLREKMILVAGNIAGYGAPDFPWGMGEPVPYRFAFAVLIPCALHLVGGGGSTPDKSFRKARLLDDRFRYRAWRRTRKLLDCRWS